MTEPAAEVARPMRVAVLSSASGGGAGIAARRLAHALNLRPDVQADFIDATVLGGRLPADVALPGSLSNRRITDTHYTVEYGGYVRGWLIEMLDEYDVINVHWASFLIGISELDELSRRGKSMLFTLHDYYYITGGCHYPAGCVRNQYGCFGCPQLDADRCDPAAVPLNLSIKQRIFSRQNVHLAAPSQFLVNEAIKAGIVPAERAHNLRNAYEPVRGISSVKDSDRRRIVLVADSLSEQRKGMSLAINALAEASRRIALTGARGFVVDIIGKPSNELETELRSGNFDYVLHGRISEHHELAEILGRSGYLLTCSYEDNWPNVLVEAGAYGCVPIVGPGHGCEEFVRKYEVGTIASGYSVDGFASAVVAAVTSECQANVVSYSRDVARGHDPAEVAERYFDVFYSITRTVSPPLILQTKSFPAQREIVNAETELNKKQVLGLFPSFGFFSSTIPLRIRKKQKCSAITVSLADRSAQYLDIRRVEVILESGAAVDMASIKEVMTSSVGAGEPRNLLSGKQFATRKEMNPWWRVEFNHPIEISEIRIYNRDDKLGERNRNIRVVANENEVDECELYAAFSTQRLKSAIDIVRDVLKGTLIDVLRGDRAIANIRSRLLVPALRRRARDPSMGLSDMGPFLDALSAWAGESAGDVETALLASVLVRVHMNNTRVILKDFERMLESKSDIDKLEAEINFELRGLGRDEIMVTNHGLAKVGKLTKNIDTTLSVLDRVIQDLEEARQKPILAYGTLLGAVREGKFIPHDDDVDILMEVDAENREQAEEEVARVVEMLRAKGWRVGVLNRLLNRHVHDTESGIMIDVFPYWREGNKCMLHMEGMKIRGIDAAIFDGRSEVDLHGKTFPAPADPVSFLAERYGPGWPVPDKFFDWRWKLKD